MTSTPHGRSHLGGRIRWVLVVNPRPDAVLGYPCCTKEVLVARGGRAGRRWLEPRWPGRERSGGVGARKKVGSGVSGGAGAPAEKKVGERWFWWHDGPDGEEGGGARGVARRWRLRGGGSSSGRGDGRVLSE